MKWGFVDWMRVVGQFLQVTEAMGELFFFLRFMTYGDTWRPFWIDAEQLLDLFEVLDEGGSLVGVAMNVIHDDGSLYSLSYRMGLVIEPLQCFLQLADALYAYRPPLFVHIQDPTHASSRYRKVSTVTCLSRWKIISFISWGSVGSSMGPG